MNEEWRDIQGYEGLYQVSNLGRVRSCDRVVRCGYGKTRNAKGLVLRPSISNVGYYYLTLAKNGVNRSVTIHRLVGKAFLTNTYNKKEIDHIDGNRLNNNVNNLRWVTAVENMGNPIARKRLSDSHKGFVHS